MFHSAAPPPPADEEMARALGRQRRSGLLSLSCLLRVAVAVRDPNRVRFFTFGQLQLKVVGGDQAW